MYSLSMIVVAVLTWEVIQDHDASRTAIVEEVSMVIARPRRSPVSTGRCSSADELDCACLANI